MLTSNLSHWIAHPELLDRDSLYEFRTLLARYPYCQSLRLLFLKNLYLLHDISFGHELRKAAVFVTDRRQLFYIIEGEGLFGVAKSEAVESPLDIPDEPGIDRTFSLIDAFLASAPKVDKELQVDSLNQISDYTSFLEEIEPQEDTSPTQTVDEPALRGQELIDNFILKAENEPMVLRPVTGVDTDGDQTPAPPLAETGFYEDDDESYFTETLAKIYIKQQRYSKALEIIKKLSLKYPKKNVYFADQIRFLEKLIINAKTK